MNDGKTKKSNAKKPSTKSTKAKTKRVSKSKKSKTKKPLTKSTKAKTKRVSKSKKSKKSESFEDIGVIVVDDDLTVDKEKEMEERKAFLEEARSQDSSD